MRKLVIAFISVLFLLVVSLWFAYLILSPLLLPYEKIDQVSFSFIGLPIIAIYSMVGMMGSGVVAIFLSIKAKKQIMRSPKFVFTPMVICALIGQGVNYANYFFVIKPNDFIECPEKIGYKKNLLHDYVKDINQCEKF